MFRRAGICMAAAVAVAALVGSARGDEPKKGAPDAYSIPLHKRHVRLTYTVEIPALPKEAKELRLWIPLATSDERQEVREPTPLLERSASGDSRIDEGVDPRTGNRFFVYTNVAGTPVDSVTLTFDVTRHEYIRKDFRGRGNQPLSDSEKKDLADYLKADRLVPVDGKIGELAKQLAGDEKNAVNLARRFYDHVLATMKYDKPAGQPWGRGDALWACDAKYGNCSDFHSVFIGLCRARGIPARFSIGFPLPEKRGEGEIGGYHCWAEFYLAGYGWVPVDISEARKHPELAEYYFGAHTEDRVQFSTGRDVTLAPPQKGEPLNYIVYPYAELDGKPWDGVKRKLTYKDLE